MKVILKKNDILEALKGLIVEIDMNEKEYIELPNICFDSRKLTSQKDWFVAIKGASQDGHQYIEKALKAGMVGYIGEKTVTEFRPKLIVKDSLKAFHQLTSQWGFEFTKANKPIIAITGSTGKTTVKSALYSMLSGFGKTLKNPRNENNDFGVPKAILNLNSEHEYALLEFGARKPKDISTLSKICGQTIGVCLNVFYNHLEIFGSIDQIYKTKLDVIRPTSVEHAIVYNDDKKLIDLAKLIRKDIITFGYDKTSTVTITSHPENKLCSFYINGSEYQIEAPYAHKMFPLCYAASMAVALTLGLDLKLSAKYLAQARGEPGRFTIYNYEKKKIIDDTYNASPESMEYGIMAASQFTGKKLFVLGDMLELGKATLISHQKIADLCLKLKPEMVITVGTHSRNIYEIIKKTICSEHFLKTEDLITSFDQKISPFDVIYLKSSRALELNRLIVDLVNH